MKIHFNPKIITWAREKAGLSLEALAIRMKKDPSEIELWERGQVNLSYTTLEKLAYYHLHIPLAVFFFPEPPRIEDPKTKYRRLPSFELNRFSPDTYRKFHLAQAYQNSLSFFMTKVDFSKRIFRDIVPRQNQPIELAQMVREYLGISIERQSKFRSCEVAFKMWRHAIESAAVFTFKDSFEDHFISGFSLFDNEYPIIFINNSNSFSRQVFTLIHELGHILYGVNGVTDFDESYVDLMSVTDRQLEINCNKFAAHFLVPDETFNNDIKHFRSTGTKAIFEIANRYAVSREVILRRLLDRGAVSQEYYKSMTAELHEEYVRPKKKVGGGNYYLTRLAYLGEGFTRIAFDNYHSGRLNKLQLANHLNMNSRYLPKIESYMRG